MKIKSLSVKDFFILKNDFKINFDNNISIYYLKQEGEIRGKKTFTDEFGINRWNLNSLEKDMSRDIFQPAWLTYLVNKYGVSATWLLTGRGEIRPKHKHTAGSQP